MRAKASRAGTLQRRETAAGYLFVAPMMIGLIIFTLFPILCSILLSFTDWKFVSGLGKIRFVGLDNFIKLFSDPIFTQSLTNNLILLIVVPVTMLVSLILAVVINGRVYGKSAFKIIFFMPGISSAVAIAIVFQVIFHPTYGPANSMLRALGLENPPLWLADPTYAILSVMFIMVWIDLGYNMLIYIAGLQNIPADLYEAAELDGASTWQKFKNITWPLLTPTTFFLLITGVIGSFKAFNLIKVLTDGGPANSTSTIVYDMYQTAFINLKTGYASSISVVLFLMILLVTALQWLGQRKWVNY